MLPLPGCHRCGQCGCQCGKLPYTVTVTFSGLKNRTHSEHCPLVFASDFGCGAAAVMMEPGGCDDDEPDCGPSNRGPVSSVLITEPGHDYARIGRREPVLTVAGSGSGATFTPTLEPVATTVTVGDKTLTLAAQCRSHKIGSVAVSGGAGYRDGETLRVIQDGTAVTKAVLTLNTGRGEPTLTASVSGGTGAVLAVTVTSNGDSPETWGVASVAVMDGGSGYTDGAAVTFTAASGDHVVTAATATIAAGTSPPTCTDSSCGYFFYSPDGGGSGSGAAARWSWTAAGSRWALTGFSFTNAGTGYAVGDHYIYTLDTDPTNGYYEIVITSVGGSGEITGWTESSDIYTATDFVGDPSGAGAITSVTVTDAGEYWTDSGVPESVTVSTPGEYFTEDPELPPCLATVVVYPSPGVEMCQPNAVQLGGEETPSIHEADLSAIIGDDSTAASWGTIVGISDADAGQGYLAWHWTCLNQTVLNGQPFVLVADDPRKLVTVRISSTFGSGACVRVLAVGDGAACDPPVDAVYDGLPGPIRDIELVDSGSGYARVGDEGIEVADVTVEVVQESPSAGSGAEISVTICNTPGDDFGKITAATLTNGGSGYTILGGPKNCIYRVCPCCPASAVWVELELRGNGKQAEVRLIDSRTESAFNYTFLRTDDPVGDCDDLPATASLFYGAQPGVTATIARGGTVETRCAPADWCHLCECPELLPETSVSITSDVPCANGGTASFEGQLQDLDLNCGYRLEAGDDIVYDDELVVDIQCCATDCDDDNPCEFKVRACAYGYVYNEDTDRFCPANGCSECVEFDIVSGGPVGTIEIPIVACGATTPVNYSMTVVVGGG